MDLELITVGKLGKTRGVFGELYVTPLTDFPERFLGLKEIFVGSPGKWEKLKIVSTRLVGGRPVIKLENCPSREVASRLTNRELAVPRDQLVELPEDTYYIFDLIGCLVYDESSGGQLGEVTDVESYPANDVYVVRMLDGSTRICPAVKSAVKLVDLKQRKIVIVTDSLLQQS